MFSIERVTEAVDILGEGPIWDADNGRLSWFDIPARKLHRLRLADRKQEQIELFGKVHAAAMCQSGNLVANVAGTGVCLLDAAGTLLRVLHNPDSLWLNDGKCDVRGRFWTGSMRSPKSERPANLYRVDAASCVAMDGGFHVVNGPGWSPSGRTMYAVDTFGAGILAYDFDAEEGAIRNRRVFIEPSAIAGQPDGICVDSDGCLWVACVMGAELARFRSDGVADARISLPAQMPTNCVFGDSDLKTLFVTTARVGMSQDALARYPLSGAVLAIRTSTPGLVASRFDDSSLSG